VFFARRLSLNHRDIKRPKVWKYVVTKKAAELAVATNNEGLILRDHELDCNADFEFLAVNYFVGASAYNVISSKLWIESCCDGSSCGALPGRKHNAVLIPASAAALSSMITSETKSISAAGIESALAMVW